MGRKPCCCDKGVKRGAWSDTEDEILLNYIKVHGEGKWSDVPRLAGLNRCGKSCRLRWLNYLRPDIKRGNISEDEEDLIIRLHKLLGNRWSLIAGRLPGRTDNEIKNFWNNNLSKRVEQKDNQNKPSNPTRTRDPSTSMNERISLLATDPASVSSQSHSVIRAKAMSCTKKIIVPEMLEPNAADWEFQSGSATTSASSTVQDNNENLRFFSLDFLEDFDIDDLQIPEVNELQYCENLQVSQEGIQNGFIADVGVVANDFVSAVNDPANPQNWMVHNIFEPNHDEDVDFSLLNLDHV